MKLLFSLFILISSSGISQSANEIVKKSYLQFKKLATYSSDVQFVFDIPSVNIKNVAGKTFYKAPDKYRVKIDGIAFIPNENPMKIYSYLSDDKKYNALTLPAETIQNMKCHVINIIPNGDAEFIIGKLWISQSNSCLYKIELTTRQGTVKMENTFKSMVKYGLPDKSKFYLENFKAPKGKGLGPKKATTDEKTGTITMNYTNYKINIPIADTLFPKPIEKKKKN